MTRQTTSDEQGSNRGSAKILLTLVLGSVSLGGLWSLLGPGLPWIGTWQQQNGEIFRLDADGTYWHRSTPGIITAHLIGTYQVVGSSGETYRLRMTTQIGEYEMQIRPESPDRIFLVDSDNPEDQSPFTRIGDWVLAMRPSSSPSSYDGAKPHLGCWQRRSVKTPDLEFLDSGTLLRYSSGEPERVVYSVDYSKMPFQLDITRSDGQVEREIFDLAADESLRLSQEHRTDGQRPEKMIRYQNYFPCPQGAESDSQGEDDVQ